MSRVVIVFLFVTLLTSCDYYYSERAKIKMERKDTIRDDLEYKGAFYCHECDQRDTVTPMGTTIHYKRIKDEFQISWGNNNYNRKYDSLFSCCNDRRLGLWDMVPKLIHETKNNLVFLNIWWTSSGGNPAPIAYSAFVFPKNKEDSIYEEYFFRNCIGNYMIYADGDLEKLNIMNLESKKIQVMTLKPTPLYYRAPGMAIRATHIENGIITVKYDSYDEKKDKDLKVTRKFKIEI